MCGEQFEALFPGLSAFGRDKQIAWIMWHSAADREAPEISRVLEGVPEDLAETIQRMICKDPKRRYASADQVLAELKASMGYGPKPPTEEELAAAAAAEEEQQKRRRRKWLLAAGCVSVLLSAAMLFWPDPPKPPPVLKLTPAEGVVQHLYPDTNRLVLDSRRTIVLRQGDQLYLNDRVAKFPALSKGDGVRVIIHKDDTGKPYQEIRASRPQVDRGEILSVQSSLGTFVLKYITEDGDEAERILMVPDTVKIRFNEKTTYRGRPVRVIDLRKGDRAVVRHDAEDEHRVVLELSVTRVTTTLGMAQGVDTDAGTLTLSTGPDGADRVTLPLSTRCDVVINGRQFVGDRLLQPADLRFGDEIEVYHDTHVVKIVAQRLLTGQGVIRDVVPSQRLVQVALDGQDQPRPFTMSEQCKVRLGDETVSLEDLHTGDRVTVRYDAADLSNPVALEVTATRPIERRRWAIVIGVQDYDDPALTGVSHLRRDAQLVRDALVNRYGVAPDEMLLLENPIRASIQQKVTEFLRRIPADGRLIVYFGGHAYMDARGRPYLAARDFELLRTEQSGLPLSWLVEQVEGSDAGEKLILLDTCHTGSGVDLRRQPSSQEQFAALDKDPHKAALDTARVITSCQEGQRGAADELGGQFAQAIALGYQGAADGDSDNRVEIDELFAFLTSTLRQRTEGRQAPAIFSRREVVAPRLSAEAKAAIGELAVILAEPEPDIQAAFAAASRAGKAAPGEPEPLLLMGLTLLKAREHAEAIKTFRAVYRKYPQRLLPVEGMIWGLYQKRQYRDAVSGLVRLVSKMPTTIGPDGQLPPDARRILPWAGRLREFAGEAVPDNYKPAATELEKIDQAVAAAGPGAIRLYNTGRQHVSDILEQLDKRIAATSDKGERLKLEKFERPRLRNYASFSIEAAAQRVMDQIER
jgi:uncharacterized caspase-like protein